MTKFDVAPWSGMCAHPPAPRTRDGTVSVANQAQEFKPRGKAEVWIVAAVDVTGALRDRLEGQCD
jgi:hypothetical protein